MVRGMRFSVWPSFQRPWSELLSLASWMEDGPWYGLWYADHLMPNTEDGSTVDGDAYECWTALAGLAALTKRLRLGSLVSPVTFHHPVVLAKRATTVDHISGGRVVLGLGAGWQVNEHAAIGVELPPPAERVRRFEEAIEIVTRLRTERRVTTTGSHFVATDLPFDPKPVQQRLPVMVGTAGRRMLRITARWADEWNTWGDPATVGAVTDQFHEACEREHREMDLVHRSAQALVFLTQDAAVADKLRGRAPAGRSLVGTAEQLVDQIGGYVELGLDELIIPDFTLGATAEERADAYAAIAELVIPAFT